MTFVSLTLVSVMLRLIELEPCQLRTVFIATQCDDCTSFLASVSFFHQKLCCDVHYFKPCYCRLQVNIIISVLSTTIVMLSSVVVFMLLYDEETI
jgi:hypothetical protein